MNTEEFFGTARERYKIMLKKDAGGILPYTKDPIYQQYRFCNVFREDDKVTKWFKYNIRSQVKAPQSVVRACAVFRWFNSIEAGACLAPWLLGKASKADAINALRAKVAQGEKIFGAAYLLSSPKGKDKITGLFECISKVEDDLEMITSEILEANTLERAHELLSSYPHSGPFMAYQMVCDLRFTEVLWNATDVHSWTCPGPGSGRGLSRLIYGEVGRFNYKSPKDRSVMLPLMQDILHASQLKKHWPREWEQWELSTVQHWLCEYDKYKRAETGEGKPKQLYRAAA